MDRRRFTTALAVTLLATPLAAEAQQAGKIARVGYLAAVSAGRRRPAVLRPCTPPKTLWADGATRTVK
jgi:hypothetical protein